MATDIASETSLVDRVRRWADERPEHVAVRWDDGETTFAGFLARMARLAHALAGRGLGEGSRVAVLDKNAPAHLEVLLGAPLIGAVGAPVNFRLSPREIVAVLRDADARIVIVGPEFVETAEAAADAIEGLEIVVLADDDDRGYEAFLAGSPSEEDPGRAIALDDVAVQMYSSGTTGLPKGAELTHANLAASLTGYDEFARFQPGSLSLACLPMFHIGGGGVALAGFHAGVTTRLIRDIVPDKMLDTIEQEGVTHAAMVPGVIAGLMAVPGVEQRDFSRWEACLYGASPISPAMLGKAVKLFGCRFSQGYGLTETTGISVLLPPEDHDPDGPNAHRLRAAGRPVNAMEVKIVTPEGEDAGTDEIGEIWLRGPNVMRGYYNKPAETAEALTDDGWFRTGDAGRLDEDGYLFIEDRIKDMIISGGENIYPFEVESAIAEHDGVADVAVVGVPSEKWGETPRAFVVLKDGEQESEDGLIAFTRERLAGFKCPTQVEFIDELPRSPAGKVLKRELRKPFWDGRDRQVS